MRRINCKYCGRIFETEAPNAKYCCLGCKDKAKRQGRTLWESKHPFYNNEYFKANAETLNQKRREKRKAI